MRLTFLIFSMAVIAVALVHLRRQETSLRHEILQIEASRVDLRRQLWSGQVDLAYKLRPEDVRRRSEEMALQMTPRPAGQLADRD